ncbi:RNA-dependent ATPase [Yamadazyma tenuis]|uniref:ATP-dependent RNA helicase DBP3 n=1 Tax=Candida tenuis (strain ATCC 10573 / BCRC 21748 / CBS 615 / JCM 9827 / NBRC 10315 / NRRL Y-1498 / VKM Y-70) TaxID=590646 RepID=G3BA82_CANTC|nr:uncharacterized protein CANTEDRAFT_94286 [Yamadazyma tenuis ATCC 10573]EGV62503.1 hypothetical protein CANTEDRAFT_94286 [Yamadazyma tenuis ATCC 10573]WEJ92596.1 RNA-dependent ATPase [Yamadazyma tenuis]
MKRQSEESDRAVKREKKEKKEKKEKSEKKEKKDKSHKKDKKDKKDKSHKKDKKDKKHKQENAEEASVSIGSIPITAPSAKADVDKFLEENQVHIESSSSSITPVLSFDQMDLHPELSKLKQFPKPTPIQSVSWPYLFNHHDVIGVAETGSGKTLAFGVPSLQKLLLEPTSDLKVLCVSPTRELAMQIYDSLVKLTKKVKISCIYGGVSKQDQIDNLHNTNIIIATPGRLLDLINDNYINLSTVNYLVLDEADRMLDQGFEKDIKTIISTLPSERQTLMFTATWPVEVQNLASSFLKNPVKITLGNISNELNANKRITQIVEVINPYDKERKLSDLLRKYSRDHDKILIFALYKKEAARVENQLKRSYRISAIHGDLNQSQRTQALQDFKTGKSQILLATDVAARGLDIPNVTLVINLTFPLTIEDYVHRIGRTGRAGKTGISHTLFTEHEKHLSGALCNILRGADQEVPEDLLKFGGHTKKKAHSAYGAFFKDVDLTKQAKKIKFD